MTRNAGAGRRRRRQRGGAVGLGAIAAGRAFVSLGTSGVLLATTDRFRPNPEARGARVLPRRPGALAPDGGHPVRGGVARLARRRPRADEADLLAPLGDAPKGPGQVLFLPYLGGERTPHNNPAARAMFSGLGHATDCNALVQAVLEGVAYAFRDCLAALEQAGTSIDAADVVGGGARSRAWVVILANVLGLRLRRLQDSEAGAALGAARLGRIAATGEAVEAVCRAPNVVEVIEPDASLAEAYAEQYRRYRDAY